MAVVMSALQQRELAARCGSYDWMMDCIGDDCPVDEALKSVSTAIIWLGETGLKGARDAAKAVCCSVKPPDPIPVPGKVCPPQEPCPICPSCPKCPDPIPVPTGCPEPLRPRPEDV